MAQITITHDDGDKSTLEIVGQWPDYKSVVEAHGYDPATVEWSVDDPDADLEQAIKDASNLQELKDALTDPKHPAQARRNR